MKIGKLKTFQGFTLIEMMVVVMIIGILSFFAYPSYRHHVLKTRRVDAKVALADLAQMQEDRVANKKSYTTNFDFLESESITTNCNGNEGVFSSQCYYALTVVVNEASGFTFTARTIGDQVKDEHCTRFTIDAIGRKRAYDKNDNVVNDCW